MDDKYLGIPFLPPQSEVYIREDLIYIPSGETSPLLQSFLFAPVLHSVCVCVCVCVCVFVCVCMRCEAGSGGVKSRWSPIPVLSIFLV